MNHKLGRKVGNKVLSQYNELPITNDFSSVELLPLRSKSQVGETKGEEPYGYFRFRDGNVEHTSCIEFAVLRGASAKSKDTPFTDDASESSYDDTMLYLGIKGENGKVEVEWKSADETEEAEPNEETGE